MAVESGKYEIIIRTTKCYAVGDEVGICLEPDGIHVMLAEDHTTSFVTTINSDYTLDFNGKVIRCDLTKVVPKSKMKDNALIDENGETVDISKLKVQVSIQPDDIEMSDEAEAGLVSGEIINLIYKGDHYSYVVRTEYGYDLIVNGVEYEKRVFAQTDGDSVWRVPCIFCGCAFDCAVLLCLYQRLRTVYIK